MIMKNKILFLFFALLSIGLVEAAPSNPYIVYGWSQISGQSANDMTIKLTNLDTGESLTDLSRDDGAFGFNLGNMPSGYSSDNPGPASRLQYTYCISDTRCNERVSSIFSVSGTGGIQSDVQAEQDGSGGSAPYVVFGTVTVDEELITSGKVKIKNVNTGQQTEVNLDSEGYQFNLAGLGYNTGDKISVTYDQITLEFTISGGGKEINFVIDSPKPSTPGSGNGGGGGGAVVPGPGGANKINQGADILNSIEPFSFEGVEKSQFTVNVGGVIHTITLFQVLSDSVVIDLLSELTRISLKVSEIRNVDLDRDRDYDVSVKLESIIEGKAKVAISKYEGSEIAETPVSEPITEEPKKDGEQAVDLYPEEDIKVEGNMVWLWWSLLIIATIVGIGYWLNKSKKRK